MSLFCRFWLSSISSPFSVRLMFAVSPFCHFQLSSFSIPFNIALQLDFFLLGNFSLSFSAFLSASVQFLLFRSSVSGVLVCIRFAAEDLSKEASLFGDMIQDTIFLYALRRRER
ncbi:hypothetical protein AVEN_83130-1 [Araneus ventricosus]|uniref:Uncharacterized protein n=1 Tax=Araneus ventricosus TaxID=182803 RepID=A0A4Y2APW1_ARAVE|nr:hypothetical protein AVEN_83130-1 [Araneus ventricosus]